MRILWFLSVLLMPFSVHGQDAAQNSMKALSSLLKTGTIRRVEILRLPDEVLTRTNVTPEALRSIASYRVTFNEGFESTFGSLLSETSLKTSTQRSDLRWGVLFYDGSGQEVGSIYVDKFGEKGYLNKEAVLFSSNLAKRLRQIIRDLH
jgi:hypothetical protein